MDNGATTYPKPPEVYSEMLRSVMQYGGNAGRGSHRLSMAASEKIFQCREAAAYLLGASESERVFFTMNTTWGLNSVIKGVVKKGDHVIISDMEHNAVFRPIYKLAARGYINYDVFRTMENGKPRCARDICSDIAAKIKRNTRMVISIHASNICSMKLPVSEIGRICRSHGIIFVVDGAQSAGHEKIDVEKMNIDVLCVPGHKGLYGPQGSGMVVLGRELILDTLAEGGNGVNSLEGNMPMFSPERYEAGTLPTPSIAGLCEGIRFVKDIGEERISEMERKLYCKTRDRLSELDRVKLYIPECEGATLLFNIDGMESERVGAELDSRGICVRSGYHCSALGHKTLGTDNGGAVRVSFGVFNNLNDIDRLCESVKEIAKSK